MKNPSRAPLCAAVLLGVAAPFASAAGDVAGEGSWTPPAYPTSPATVALGDFAVTVSQTALSLNLGAAANDIPGITAAVADPAGAGLVAAHLSNSDIERLGKMTAALKANPADVRTKDDLKTLLSIVASARDAGAKELKDSLEGRALQIAEKVKNASIDLTTLDAAVEQLGQAQKKFAPGFGSPARAAVSGVLAIAATARMMRSVGMAAMTAASFLDAQERATAGAPAPDAAVNAAEAARTPAPRTGVDRAPITVGVALTKPGATVKLKDGSSWSRIAAREAEVTIKSVAFSGGLADLVARAKDVASPMDEGLENAFKGPTLSLLDAQGRVKPLVKAVLLSGVEGEGASLGFGSPYAAQGRADSGERHAPLRDSRSLRTMLDATPSQAPAGNWFTRMSVPRQIFLIAFVFAVLSLGSFMFGPQALPLAFVFAVAGGVSSIAGVAASLYESYTGVSLSSTTAPGDSSRR